MNEKKNNSEHRKPPTMVKNSDDANSVDNTMITITQTAQTQSVVVLLVSYSDDYWSEVHGHDHGNVWYYV